MPLASCGTASFRELVIASTSPGNWAVILAVIPCIFLAHSWRVASPPRENGRGLEACAAVQGSTGTLSGASMTMTVCSVLARRATTVGSSGWTTTCTLSSMWYVMPSLTINNVEETLINLDVTRHVDPNAHHWRLLIGKLLIYCEINWSWSHKSIFKGAISWPISLLD